jgi:hypothetical protein
LPPTSVAGAWVAAIWVTMGIMDLIAVEVGGRMLPTNLCSVARMRYRTAVSVIGMIVGIDMTVEVGRAVKPWARTDEDTTGKPFGAIVAVGRTPVRSRFIVSVRAVGSDSDVDADLGLGFGSCRSRKSEASYSC